MQAYGFIYVTTNNINGKKYIGQTKKSFDSAYLGSGKAIKRAIAKYGAENFTREIIAVAFSKCDLDFLEEHFISEFNAVADRNWYNISSAPNVTFGFAGKQHTQEWKEARRADMLTNHPNKGKKFSGKICANMSSAKQGKSFATEKSRASSRRNGKANSGIKRSEDFKSKRSNLMKNKPRPGREVISAVQTPDGIITTNCLKNWCIEHNINYSSLRNTLKRNSPTKTGFMLLHSS